MSSVLLHEAQHSPYLAQIKPSEAQTCKRLQKPKAVNAGSRPGADLGTTNASEVRDLSCHMLNCFTYRLVLWGLGLLRVGGTSEA